MRIVLYVGENGFDWSNAVDASDWERANRVVAWLVGEALKRYGELDIVACGLYGYGVECYDEETKAPQVELEASLRETIDEVLQLFVENQGFWLTVPVPYEPYFSCEYESFLQLERTGEIRILEPRDDHAQGGLYALTDLSEESWVGEVVEVSAEAIPGVSVGDYVVCDGVGAPVRFYRAP